MMKYLPAIRWKSFKATEQFRFFCLKTAVGIGLTLEIIPLNSVRAAVCYNSLD